MRKSDGELVALKKTRKSIHPHEVEIGRYLSSPPLSEDSRNYCCPVYASLHPPEHHGLVIMVMPFLPGLKMPSDGVLSATSLITGRFAGSDILRIHGAASTNSTWRKVVSSRLRKQ